MSGLVVSSLYKSVKTVCRNGLCCNKVEESGHVYPTLTKEVFDGRDLVNFI